MEGWGPGIPCGSQTKKPEPGCKVDSQTRSGQRKKSPPPFTSTASDRPVDRSGQSGLIEPLTNFPMASFLKMVRSWLGS